MADHETSLDEETIAQRAQASAEGSHEAATGPPADTADRSATEAEVADLRSQLLRALADLDNMRKRFERELRRERAAERTGQAAKWVAVVDNLDRALEHADGPDKSLGEGLRAVRDQAVAILADLGFPRYADIGSRFDPSRHEALGAVPEDSEPGTIVAAVRPGYGRDSSILRPAGVIVSERAEA